MDLKEKKDFALKRESSTFPTWGKNKVKNKELFPGEFVCVFLLLLKVGKIPALVEFHSARTWRFLKSSRETSVTDTIINKVSDLQNGCTLSRQIQE